MKKLQLLFAAMIIGMASATASEFVSETKAISLDKAGEDLTITKRYRYTQPILFVERGVEFLIFPDGSFDFNTEYGNWSNDEYYQRGNRSRRGTINRTSSVPGSRTKYTSSRYKKGVRVLYNRRGDLKKVGNVFINYDRRGQVRSIGTVNIRYNRKGLVSQIGGLKMIYNKRSKLIRTLGDVNRFNRGFKYTRTTQDNWIDDDANFYYYKRNGKVKKVKRHKKRPTKMVK